MNKYLLLIILLVTGLTGARAQYDSQLSQYFMALGYYNPAYAGVTGDLNMLALSRLQYVGIDGAPTSFFINADMPLKIGKTNHGIGMVVFTEGIGLFVNTHVNLQYAYKQKLFGGTLSIGMQFGMVNQSFDGEKVFYPTSQFHQQEDPGERNGLRLERRALLSPQEPLCRFGRHALEQDGDHIGRIFFHVSRQHI